MDNCRGCHQRQAERARWGERGSVILIAAMIAIVLGVLQRCGFFAS